MDCRDVHHLLDLSLDDELGGIERRELAEHVSVCAACRSRMVRAARVHSCLRSHLQSVQEPAPEGLRRQIGLALRADVRSTDRGSRGALLLVGVALLVLEGWSVQPAANGLDLERAVARHAARLPPEVRPRGDPAEVERFLRENLDRAVSLPWPGMTAPLRLVGARLDHVGDRPAGLLMYDHRGARVSVLVRPAFGRSEGAAPRALLVRRDMDGRSAWFGEHRGYRVAAWQDDGLDYAAVADLDPIELEALVRVRSRLARFDSGEGGS